MKNHSDQWTFFKRRGQLNEKEAVYWRNILERLLKAGIELEYNLPEKNGSCNRDNFMCNCVATFTPKVKIPNTTACYEQCANWDNSLDASGQPVHPKDGNCQIAKEHGCAGMFCSSFKAPCPSCNKYDRGCNNCAELYDIRKDPNNIRNLVTNELKPTKFVGEHGATGVYKVCKDGSLLGDGGVEVATVGRRPQFFAIYDQMKKIMKTCTKYGAYTNERCSIHIHLLASYLNGSFDAEDRGKEFLNNEVTEMEKPMPEIILANFHQLVRRYHCALIWMGAAGTEMKHLTRWEKFRKPILAYSAAHRRMTSVVDEVRGASKQKPKYAMMNYDPVKFNLEGDVTRLHLEARYLDGMLSPSVVAAHTVLLYALMLKAVDMSRYGILESGSEDYMNKQKEMLKYLCNNDGDWQGGNRFSDTSHIRPYIPALQEQSMLLVRLVKSVLNDQSPADRILKSLAQRPVAMRLIDGQTWEQIEADLGPGEEAMGPVQQLLSQIIDTSSIGECDSGEEWIETAATQLANAGEDSPEHIDSLRKTVEAYVTNQVTNGKLFWSKETGSYTAKG